MQEFNAKNIYLNVKKNKTTYSEEIHCPMILNIMNQQGTVATFCKAAQISVDMFYDWTKKHSMFKECYHIGKAIARANWEEDGKNGKDSEDFNFDYWRITGLQRYGAGNSPRVRVEVDSEANPYEQYKQLIKQAGNEEFTASELKQLMESINVGRSVFESFKLQEEMDAMKNDVQRMNLNHVNNSRTTKDAAETN
jgi:hypothetical protein